jgi:hypothetical protein
MLVRNGIKIAENVLFVQKEDPKTAVVISPFPPLRQQIKNVEV